MSRLGRCTSPAIGPTQLGSRSPALDGSGLCGSRVLAGNVATGQDPVPDERVLSKTPLLSLDARGSRLSRARLAGRTRRAPTPRAYGAAMNSRWSLVVGISIIGLAITGCGSGSSHTASPTTAPAAATAPSATTASSAPTGPVPTTGAVAAGAPTCPTMAQADAALGVSDTGPIRTAIAGGGILCRYTAPVGYLLSRSMRPRQRPSSPGWSLTPTTM